jgi:hypothetical protein
MFNAGEAASGLCNQFKRRRRAERGRDWGHERDDGRLM